VINLNKQHYQDEIRVMLNSSVTRIFLWRLIVEDCKVFEADFAMNASAYALLAKQEIGKRLLEDMKRVSPELTFQAEAEYNAMMAHNTQTFSQEEGE
jgi:hypothetical protein